MSVSIDSYLEYVSMPRKATVKKLRSRISPLRRELDATKERNKKLEDAFKHWFKVGKSDTHPCIWCQLPISDSIHRDSHVQTP